VHPRQAGGGASQLLPRRSAGKSPGLHLCVYPPHSPAAGERKANTPPAPPPRRQVQRVERRRRETGNAIAYSNWTLPHVQKGKHCQEHHPGRERGPLNAHGQPDHYLLRPRERGPDVKAHIHKNP